MTPDQPRSTSPEAVEKPTSSPVLWVLRAVVGLAALALIILAGSYAYAYSFSPEFIRHPTSAHFHLRLQIVNNGKNLDFGQAAYQTEFSKDICSAKLTKEPVHFHDNLSQFLHVHWSGMTGGAVLKNYGWNLIGGPNATLGYNFTSALKPVRLPIHGQALPERDPKAKYFVYTGSASTFKQRDWNAFLHQDLRSFMAGTVVHAGHGGWLGIAAGLQQLVVPTALADDMSSMPGMSSSPAAASSEEELKRINDVIGNVVIFVQPTEPTQEQVKARFEDLVPLPVSACGG